MAIPNPDYNQSNTYREAPRRGNGLSTFLSGVAVLLSSLALLFSGFSAYQVFNLQQKINPATNSPNQSYPAGVTNPAIVGSNTTPASPVSPQVPNVTGVQPSQFVQPAFDNEGQVELLSVKRIKNPDTGRNDIVNVQIRIRSLGSSTNQSRILYPGSQTTARNPETSEDYRSVKGTSYVDLSNIATGTSADAYIWLPIPERVNSIDIFIKNVQAFNNVPIAN